MPACFPHPLVHILPVATGCGVPSSFGGGGGATDAPRAFAAAVEGSDILRVERV